MSDLPALTEMLSSKGHGGVKCCPVCKNATNHKPPGGAVPMHTYSDYCVPITETKYEKFIKHTNASLLQMVQKLQKLKDDPAVQKTEREELETSTYGYSWTPWSIIHNQRFKIPAADGIMFDWGHTYACDGIADQEFGRYMRLMHRGQTQRKIRHVCHYQQLGKYLESWTWPKSRGNPCHMFDEEHAQRFIKSGSFNSTASEFLSLAPLIKRYLQRVVQPQIEHVSDLALATKSMIAGFEVLAMLQACAIKGAVSPTLLAKNIKCHLDLFKECHGEDEMRPKHHYALHLPGSLAKFGVLLSTFTHERKHRCIKRYARVRTILKSYEVSLLEEATCHNLWELGDKHWEAISTRSPNKKQKVWLEALFPGQENAVFTLHNQVYRKAYLTRGDIVVFQYQGEPRIGELLLNVGVQQGNYAELVAFVTLWEHKIEKGFATCVVKEAGVRIPTAALVAPLTYRMSADGASCVVVLPYDFRVKP